MTADKNDFIKAAAKVCKKQGVKKMIAVCPIEYDLYYTEDQVTPAEKKLEAQYDAVSANPATTVINTNLVYGRDSYLLHFMSQCVAAGKIPKGLTSGNFHYNPVHVKDIVKAIDFSLNNFVQVQG